MAHCKHDCEKTPLFPVEILNRPALESIDYRIGAYSVMRAHMLDLLNGSVTLASWTHRGPDDPGIAVLEGNAIVGDILTFYQNLYSNEAFLRTARWRESVAELVRLLGYRLAPGVGGEATFALQVKGEVPVTVPKGFGFKAQLAGRDPTDEFESIEEITAYPHLGAFNLYRPPLGMQAIEADGVNNKLELHAVDGKRDLASRMAVEFNPGDRIMLVPDSGMFDITGTVYTDQASPEILIVSEVETVLDRVIVTFEGALTVSRGSTIRAYPIGRSFRHFGYNAPTKFTKFDGTSVAIEDTEFERVVAYTHYGSDDYARLSKLEMPLDQEVDDLAAGGKLICQGLTDFDDYTIGSQPERSNRRFTVVKTITGIGPDTLKWGNVEGPTTVVKLDAKLMTNEGVWNETTDVRRTLFHEVLGPELALRAPTEFDDGAFADSVMQFFGTYRQARALAKRPLFLVGADGGSVQEVATTSSLDDFQTQLVDPADLKDEIDSWLWSVVLSSIPAFDREDADQAEPRITVYGNLARANQGKTEQQMVLGSGDSRQSFQTFDLPKAPLTYLLDENQTPAQAPELQVYVAGRLWKRVDTFFNSGPEDQVYVVREDQDGNSWIQCGDGKSGARLPSGRRNVVALYRTGNGAAGLLEDDAKPQATGKLKQLEDVFLPAEVVGGDQAESLDIAKEAAPGRMQSLGRLVGLADIEAETLALPGVLRARADWVESSGAALVRVVVLTQSGTAAAVENIQGALKTYSRCRGPARYAIEAERGLLQYIYLKVRVGYAANRLLADIEAEVKEALGLTGEEGNGIEGTDGLFSLKNRRFGQGVHCSQILAAVQQIDGVTWVEIDDAQALDLGTPAMTDPSELPTPAVAAVDKAIACPATRILALHGLHLDLSLAIDDTRGECA